MFATNKVLSSYTSILFEQPGLAQSVLVTRPSGPAYLSLAEGILALLSASGVPPPRAAWAVDILLHFATSTAAEQGTRHRAAGAEQEEDALAAALREAPAGTFPQIAGLGAELMSGGRPGPAHLGLQRTDQRNHPDPPAGGNRTARAPGTTGRLTG
jgi:hypothetical protein